MPTPNRAAARRCLGAKASRAAPAPSSSASFEAGTKDISLAEIVERLKAERDVRVGITSGWKYLDRHGLTHKKTAQAVEQQREDVLMARQA